MKTCLPEAAARSTCAPCSLCGVANTTASISGSANISSRLSTSFRPCSAQNASALPRVRLCPAVKRNLSLLPCTEPTRVRPHLPMPTIAARITCPSRVDAPNRFYTWRACFAIAAADAIGSPRKGRLGLPDMPLDERDRNVERAEPAEIGVPGLWRDPLLFRVRSGCEQRLAETERDDTVARAVQHQDRRPDLP